MGRFQGLKRLCSSSPPCMPASPMKKAGGQKELAAAQIEEVKEAFQLFDVDSSGAISYKELRACMKALQIKVDKEELKKMIFEVDADQSGEIEFPEFLQMMTGKMASGDSKEEILKVYKMFDADGDGVISFAALKRVARELGESMTDEEIASMLEHGNKSGKPGKGVGFDDFYRLMKKRSNNQGLDDMLGDDD